MLGVCVCPQSFTTPQAGLPPLTGNLRHGVIICILFLCWDSLIVIADSPESREPLKMAHNSFVSAGQGTEKPATARLT